MLQQNARRSLFSADTEIREHIRTFSLRSCHRFLQFTRGDPKITGIIVFKWFIRFCTISTLVSFKILSFWLDSLVPTFFPLLKTFLELFSADVVQDLQRFLFHFAGISKTLPFHLAFLRREQGKVAWRKVGWIGRTRDKRLVIFCQKLLHFWRPCGQGHCRGEGTNHRCSTFLVVFSVHCRVIFSTPSNKIVDSQFVQEEQIPCAQFH